MDRHGHTPKGCPVVQRVPIFLATDKGEFVISVVGGVKQKYYFLF